VTPQPEYRLEELFVRYWDGALTPAEAGEFERLLAADPVARERFQSFCLQAVAAAEQPAVAGAFARPHAGAKPGPAARGLSRRRLLRLVGGGVAASAAAGFLAHRYWPAPPAPELRLVSAHGTVTVRTADGEPVPPFGPVPPGGTVTTQGPAASALLSYADGTDIALAGETVVTVADRGRQLFLRQGTATASVAQQLADAVPLTLVTSEATLPGLSKVLMTLCRTLQATEVGVQRGLVTVAAATGAPLGVVCGGEVLTVQANGQTRKQTIPTTPDEFAWDLTRPLPQGWHVGTRELTPDGPVVRPSFWFDPYHQTMMSQIRSDHQWARGFFRLHPDSLIRVRYWVDQPGRSQLVVCVRTGLSSCSETGVMECNDAFLQARPRQWQWLEVRAGDMLHNIHAPGFGAPWVGFLVIFNTYEVDLGLKVAEFRVTPPPGAVPGAAGS
jgi:ferric-dicitrate binding protein FerR (iron transport regulator)